MQTLSIDSAIIELAASSCSVVHARDLRRAGIGRDAIARRIRIGSMAQLLPRTYGVGPQCQSPSFEMLAMAGVLAGGDGAHVDGVTAATLRDVWNRGPAEIHVALPNRPAFTPPAPFVFHRSTGRCRPGGEKVGPIPVVSFIDMCLRLARTMTPWQLAFVIQGGVFRDLVRLSDIEAALDVCARTPWIGVLRDAVKLLRDDSVGTRTKSEDVALEALLRAGAPVPFVNTRGVHGLSRDEPDLFWRRERLNVEIDGEQHREPRQAADDLRRDHELADRGIRVIRVWSLHLWPIARRRRIVGHVMRALRGEPVPVGADRHLIP
jgi:very-short-patch-repair endonuclease